MFHLSKNLWDTLKTKKATSIYNTSNEFQVIVDLLSALPYAKPSSVVAYFVAIIEPLVQKLPEDFPEPAMDYIDYVVKTYIGRPAGRSGARRSPLFKPELWSAYEDILAENPTTNNAVEAFNAQWNSTKKPSDNLWSVIDAFKQEDSLAQERHLHDLADVRDAHAGPEEGRRRKIAQRAREERIFNIVKKFETMTPAEYLFAVSSVIKK